MHDRRKREHLRISLEEDVGFRNLTSGFERYRFIHQALPELPSTGGWPRPPRPAASG